MAFNTIVVGTNTYNSIGSGIYRLSTIQYGQPANDIKITPGRRQKNSVATTASITAYIEKDVTVGSNVFRRKAYGTLNLFVEDGFTTAEVDQRILLLSDFSTADSISRILMGES